MNRHLAKFSKHKECFWYLTKKIFNLVKINFDSILLAFCEFSHQLIIVLYIVCCIFVFVLGVFIVC